MLRRQRGKLAEFLSTTGAHLLGATTVEDGAIVGRGWTTGSCNTPDAATDIGSLAALLSGAASPETLLADGRAVPHIGATFPLAEAAAALQYVADGRAIGKVVIDVAPTG